MSNNGDIEVATLSDYVWWSNIGLDVGYGVRTPTHWKELPENPA